LFSFDQLSLRFEISRSLGQAVTVATAKLGPDVAWLAEVLVQLENAPHIDLVILLMFGIDRIELSGGAAGREQGGVEETGESFECAGQGGGGNVEIIIGV
jgi:hypothetical protein